MPDANEIKQITNPKNIPVPSPKDSTKGGSTILLNTDPNHETVILRPSANASSFPKNHQDTTTV